MEDNKKLDERDFHHGEGHSIPVILRIAWAIYFIVAVTFVYNWVWPSLKVWIFK
ncbi:MAG: hypothetical protein WDA09_04770 [Bacteriovoracaceae bacterium]